MTRRLIVILLTISGCLRADGYCGLDFPDSSGKIVARGSGYLIRLIETGAGGVKTAQARFHIDADRESCWRVIMDFDRYPGFMPNIKSATRIFHTDSSDRYAFTLKALIRTISYTIDIRPDRRADSVWVLPWSYVGGDLKSTTGSWRVYECKDRPGAVLMCYTVRVDIGKLMPAFIANHLTAGSIPELISAVRMRAEHNRAATK